MTAPARELNDCPVDYGWPRTFGRTPDQCIKGCYPRPRIRGRYKLAHYPSLGMLCVVTVLRCPLCGAEWTHRPSRRGK
jgi:hypothetical protein